MSAITETSQSSVLDVVRRALGRRNTLSPAPLEPFIEPIIRIEVRELVERFVDEATAVRAQVHRVPDNHQLVEKIVEISAAQRGEVAMSGAELFREIDLPGELAAHGLSTFIANQPDHEQLVATLANCGVGVTAADFAIAETGTIVLSSDEPNALLVSLLPPVHIALVRSEQMIGTIDEAMRKTGSEQVGRTDPPRSVTMVTGPSRTSDVELVLSIGVHGPKELHVIILD